MSGIALARSDVAPEDVYLHTYLRPFAPWLAAADVTEILVNRPGELWIERAGAARIERVAAPEIDGLVVERLAIQVARITAQGINRENPLLAASLPGGARIQIVAPPAAAFWTLAIRRHIMCDLSLDDFAGAEPVDTGRPAGGGDPGGSAVARLKAAVADRATILISGGTSSGKTTFLNALLKQVPATERVITIEDTPEIVVGQPNAVRLYAVKGELGEARVGVDDLLQASLRLRPDRLIVGEIRGREAASFLRAINTGHAGSFTTVHANSPAGALEQVALMVMQAGSTLSYAETIAYCRNHIGVIVQLARIGGRRAITAVEVVGSAMAGATMS
jgi:type IV secretion system protein VirB11